MAFIIVRLLSYHLSVGSQTKLLALVHQKDRRGEISLESRLQTEPT